MTKAGNEAAKAKILIVDDEPSMLRFLSIMLGKEGYAIRTAATGKDALLEMQGWRADLVISDIKMPEMDGIQLLAGVKAVDPQVPVILLTAYASQESAIEAVNKGAFHYLIKQARNDEIRMVVRNALTMREVSRENRDLKQQIRDETSLDAIIGASDAMQDVFTIIRKVAMTDSTVLISGDSGTGKELIARACHFMSQRSERAFVTVNCGALPENLLESELFGHVKGSFTGAIRDKDGLFKVAEGGTILLDEVGEIPLSLQVKLLRALQEKEFLPVGGTQPISVDVRVLAATNRDLEEEVHRGTFRPDLFYRLNVIPVPVPALRERRDDIPLLVKHFVDKLSGRAGQADRTVSAEAMEMLCRYDWPGNVRELENILERAMLLEERDELSASSFPAKLRQGGESSGQDFFAASPRASLEDLEREYLLRVLESTGWHKKKASAILGINASTLYRKIQRYDLRPSGSESVPDPA